MDTQFSFMFTENFNAFYVYWFFVNFYETFPVAVIRQIEGDVLPFNCSVRQYDLPLVPNSNRVASQKLMITKRKLNFFGFFNNVYHAHNFETNLKLLIFQPKDLTKTTGSNTAFHVSDLVLGAVAEP